MLHIHSDYNVPSDAGISGSMKNQYVITASCNNYYQVSTIDDGSQVGQEAGIEP